MRDLSRSTVVITGASSGIGRTAARALAREGARLVLAGRAFSECLQQEPWSTSRWSPRASSRARDPKREVTIKRLGRGLELLHSLAPPLYHRVLPAGFEAGATRARG